MYAQSQLDLVKAFEYVRHRRLAAGARRLGYPTTMLVLSLAAYTAPRRVTVACAMSREVKPTKLGRGWTGDLRVEAVGYTHYG